MVINIKVKKSRSFSLFYQHAFRKLYGILVTSCHTMMPRASRKKAWDEYKRKWPFGAERSHAVLCIVVKERCLLLFQSLAGCLYTSLSLVNQRLTEASKSGN